jgi:nitrogen fixation protein FixH
MRALTITLTNRDGQPLDGADVTVEAFAHSRANDRLQLELRPLGDGHYAVESPFRRAGLWEFRFTVQRGPDTFTAIHRKDVTDPRGKSAWRP